MKPYRIYEHHSGILKKLRSVAIWGIRFDNVSLEAAKESIHNEISHYRGVPPEFVIVHYTDNYTSKIVSIFNGNRYVDL